MSISQVPLSRRRFIVGAGALVIGAYLPSTGALARSNAPAAAGATAFDANAFVQIGADGIVTVISKHTEVGQGVYTGMATLVAEELDADWAQVRVVAAPVDTAVYKNLAFGFQGTGGSSSVANAYEQMRRMGAMARALLVQAAAQSWKTSAQEITVQAGKIRHAASGREAGFGEFAELAATLPPPDPASLALKDPANFTLIGKTRGLHRVDSLAKTNGSAQFSQDIHEPDMLTVTLKKPPRFGGKVATFDADRALAVPGVVAVKQVATGVAVYAKNTWAAIQGRDRLRVTWDDAQAERRNTEEIYAEFRQVAQKTGVVAKSLGKPDEVFDKADKVIEAEYTFPYVAHAPMEPLDGYLFWDGESVKARYGCQIQTLDHKQLCDLFELPPEKVQIETILAGGSFGRRIDLGNPTLGPDLAADMAAAPRPRREGGMDARGRHPQRLVSPDDPASPARRHSRRQGGGLGRYRSRPLLDAPQRDGCAGGQRPRSDDGRGRQRGALYLRSLPLRCTYRARQGADHLAAVGRQHPHRPRGGELYRSTAAGNRAGSGGRAAGADGRRAARGGRVAGGGQSR